MGKATILAIVVGLGATIHGQSSTPHTGRLERLAHLVGRWAIEERYAGDASAYTKTSTCELFAGGAHLVCRSDADTPLGRSTGLEILSYDRARQTFTHYTIASVGLAVLATGTVTDRSWNGTTEFSFNGEIVKARITIGDESPDAWTYRMERALGGSRTIVLLEARATRVPAG